MGGKPTLRTAKSRCLPRLTRAVRLQEPDSGYWVDLPQGAACVSDLRVVLVIIEQIAGNTDVFADEAFKVAAPAGVQGLNSRRQFDHHGALFKQFDSRLRQQSPLRVSFIDGSNKNMVVPSGPAVRRFRTFGDALEQLTAEKHGAVCLQV